MAVRLDQVRDDDTLVKGDGGENKQTKKKEGEFKKKHKESKMHIKGYRKEPIFT